MSSLDQLTVKNYYEKYWTDPEAYNRHPGPRALHLLETYVLPDRRVLDVGCGSACVFGPWIRGQGAQYTGVDVSQNAVNHAQKLGLEATVIEDASCLPFADSTFEVAICMEVLEHIFQPNLAAREILRVLTPDGALIVTVPNLTHWRHRLSFVAGRWDPSGDERSVQEPWRDPHVRFFTSRTLRRMLQFSGFASVEVFGEEPVRLRRIPWLGNILGRPSTKSLIPISCSHNLVAIASK